MSLDRTNFDEIKEDDLRALIANEVPEGLAVEYKREPYGFADADKKEALKDISSFANTTGGHLIVGMAESEGLPTALTGLPDVDIDALKNRLESLMRDGLEPRIIGARMRTVKLKDGGVAFIVRIPQSWHLPHRVRAGNSNRFYVRNSGGSHEASVEELRTLFTLGADSRERMRTFRDQRLVKMIRGESPVPVSGNGTIIVHLMPLSAFAQTTVLDLALAYKLHEKFRPMGQDLGMTPRPNLEGVVNVRRRSASYTQIFRNGIVEAAKGDALVAWQNDRVLHAGNATGMIVEALPSYLEGLRSLDIPTPIVITATLLGVAGAKLGIKGYDRRLDEIEPFPAGAEMMLPEVILEDYGSPMAEVRVLQPLFDALWNSAGFLHCNYFDKFGEWKPPH